MSLYNKDFLKDSLLGGNPDDSLNDYDTNQFFTSTSGHPDATSSLSFGNDSSTTHQNGFSGLSGYGAHGIGQLNQQQQQQQQRGLPSSGLSSLPQGSQLYRTTTPGQSSTDNLHSLGRSNLGPISNFPSSQGIIGGNIGNTLGGGGGGIPGLGGGGSNGRIPYSSSLLTSSNVGDNNNLSRFNVGNPSTIAPGGNVNAIMLQGRGNRAGGLSSSILDDDDNDDFPALPSQQQQLHPPKPTASAVSDGHSSSSLLFGKELGSIGGGGGGSEVSSLGSSSLLGGDRPRSQSNNLYEGGSGGGVLGNLGLSASIASPAATTAAIPPPVQSTSSSLLLGNKDNRFGMAGLLELIRSQEKDIHVLSLGTDLTTFGLNLNATESLYTSFTSPFSEGSTSANSDEPSFKTPQCYLMPHPPVLKADHWSKLTVETLFYIFYQMPRDILQACSAQELYRRDWRYHSELRIWLKPHSQQPPSQQTIGQPPSQQQQTTQFVYFDAKNWEQKFLNTSQIRGNLLAGLIPEEEIRVKAPTPGNQQQQQQGGNVGSGGGIVVGGGGGNLTVEPGQI